MFAGDRLRAAIEAVVRAMLPRVDTLALYEARVVQFDEGAQLADVVPASAAYGLPLTLTGLPVRPGVPGARCLLPTGASVLVGFVGGDAARPYVLAFDAAASAGFRPTHVAIDAVDLVEVGKTATVTTLADGTLGAARKTDAVQAGPFAGAILGGSTKVRVG